MNKIISIKNINKVYEGGFRALDNINLDIKEGEIFALLGPNGAGKTTLINMICGIVNKTSGDITINGLDHLKAYKEVRKLIGLVPQELTRDAFETVFNTVKFSRELFGQKKNDAYLKQLLKDLSLDDKINNKLMTLSGGMKRRVMIAKALSHEPRILFLDEPTAGVDVELRKSMWDQVKKLKDAGVTIILTTHYIEEAEQMADRVGVISKGKIILVEDKVKLMEKLGQKKLVIKLHEKLSEIPDRLSPFQLDLTNEGKKLIYFYHEHQEDNGIEKVLPVLHELNIKYKDLHTEQSSLEEIFVNLVSAQ